MVDDQNIIFTCPKCDQTFTLGELLNHDTTAFNNYVEALVKEKKASAVKKELATFKIQADLEKHSELQWQKENFAQQKEKILEKNRQDVKQLEAELQAKKTDLEVLEKTQEKEIAKKIAEAKSSFAQELNDLQLIIKDKTNIIDNQKQEIEKEINEIRSQDQIEYLNLKNAIEKEQQLKLDEYQTQLNEAQNNLKIFETNKQLEIENQVQATKEHFNQQITDLKLKVQATEAEMSEKITVIIHEKENEYRDQKAQLDAQHQEEIAKLRADLERNKVFSNKIKGENFEQEVENELRKAFQYFDKIEKITEGDTKADYLQVVKNSDHSEIGKIVYEVKNAEWSDAWLPKFATDIAKKQTKYGILIATSFNKKFKGDISFIQSDEYENIWIADPWSFIFVAQVVRKLIETENNFLVKEKQLSYSETSEGIKDYNQKILRLKEYIDFGLPEFLKSFKIQITNLEKIQNSMQKNTNNLEKTRLLLRKKFDKLVKNKLEEIVGQVIVENQTSDYIEEKMDDAPLVNEEVTTYQN